MSQVDLVLIAGEASGDLQGASLIRSLLQLDPTLKIAAVAGPLMREHPIELIEPMEQLQVMGFTDVIRALPKLIPLFFSLRNKLLALKPKAVITIDYPGLNLRLQRSLRSHRFRGKQIHYVCPSVWAWGKKRIPLMAKNLDLLLALLPFEPACFANTALDVRYIGHPLASAIAAYRPDPFFFTRYNLNPQKPLCALFPGSRIHEIERNLPMQVQAACALDLPIAISCSHPNRLALIRRLAPNSCIIEPQDRYHLMHNATIALAKSGTVTLELALHKTPTVVTYFIKPFDLFLARRIFRINLPYYALPNIAMQDEVFPELFGPNLTLPALSFHAKRLAFDPQARARCRAQCSALIDRFGQEDAASKAAQAIYEIV